MMKELIVAAVFIAVSSVSGVAQDAQKGKAVFNICLACHAIGPGAQNKIGPESMVSMAVRRAWWRISTTPMPTRTQAFYEMRIRSRSTLKIQRRKSRRPK
jgi:mono/diheme cytochrome c family protein